MMNEYRQNVFEQQHEHIKPQISRFLLHYSDVLHGSLARWSGGSSSSVVLGFIHLFISFELCVSDIATFLQVSAFYRPPLLGTGEVDRVADIPKT